MKNLAKLGIVVFVSTVVLTACGTKEEKGKIDSAEKVVAVKLGVMPSTDNLPLLVAHKEGLDKKNGVTIEIEPFKAAKDRDAAFSAGKVDGVISDVIALAIYENANMNVKVTSTTHDQFALTTMNPEIKSIKDLKGKKVVVVKNGGIGYAADKMLQAGGLTEKDVELLDIPPVPTRLELMKARKADAAVIPEPFITIGKKDGLRVLENTNNIKINPFVVAFPEKTVKSKKSGIQGLYKAYDQAVEEINKNLNNKEKLSEYRDLLVKNVGFPEPMRDQIEITEFPKAAQISEKDITDAFSWASERGLLKKEMKASDVLDDQFIK